MTDQTPYYIDSIQAALDETAARVAALQKARPCTLVAIDGGSCSGKTTFAARLGERLNANVFHMDDYFLPPHMRTPERLVAPGGNVDAERFLQEVLLPLQRGETVYSRRYDCHKDVLLPPAEYPQRIVSIAEGAYSLRPDLAAYYDLRIFCRVESASQMERVLARNGSRQAEIFRTRWIPMENAYFAAFGVESSCDLVLELR